jgi:hypothetical protein
MAKSQLGMIEMTEQPENEAYIVYEDQLLDIDGSSGDESVFNSIHCQPLSEHDAAIEQAAREEERKKSRNELLKDLQKFIDNADSRIGCPNGTLGIAYLIQWMGGQGWDCD